MKTIELTGPALDWAVAKAADYLRRQGDHWMVALPYVSARMNFVPGPRCVFSPSTRWAQGGPLIEREMISVMLSFAGSHAEGANARPTGWAARKYVYGVLLEPLYYGPTPLVAAMRCFVASRLGDTVEIPDELKEHQ